MAGHELDALRHHLVGDRHRLLRIAGIVADFQHQLLAVDAARRIDVGHRHFGAALELLAEGRILAGDRTGDADRDVGQRRGGRQRGGEAEGNARQQIVSSFDDSLGFTTGTVFRGLHTPWAGI